MAKIRKKYLVALLTLLLSFSLVACGKMDQEPEPPIDEEDTIEGPLEDPLEDEDIGD